MSDRRGERAAKVLAILYGALCHAAFATAVLGMAFSLYGGMQSGWGRLRGPSAWAANGLLLAQFPLGHSLLLTARGRSWLSRLAPSHLGADLVTTTYVILASVQVLLAFALWSPSGIMWWSAAGPLRWALSAAFVGAWILLGKSMYDASLALQTGYLGWTAVWKGSKPAYGPMPTRGLFTWCRQPIYVSFALILWTVPVWTPDSLFIACAWTLYCLIGPLHKESTFARRYGAAFAEYRARVPYWLPIRPRRTISKEP